MYIQCISIEVDVRTKIQKWGNSLGLRIPKSFAVETGIEEGSDVELSVKDGQLTVRPILRPRYDLNELLQRVTPRNVHGEIETGDAVGREGW